MKTYHSKNKGDLKVNTSITKQKSGFWIFGRREVGKEFSYKTLEEDRFQARQEKEMMEMLGFI